MTSDTSFPKSLPQALALSALTGLLLVLSFPNVRWWPLIFVAVIPFDFAIQGQTWRRALLLGGVVGFVLQSYLMFWSSFFGIPAFLFLAFFRTYPYLFIGLGWAQLSRCRHTWMRLLGCGCCWVFVEYYQTWGGLGATWGMLSHTLARQTALLQICSLGGPWLLSALVIAVNLLFAQSLRRHYRFNSPALLATGLLAVSSGFGSWRLAQPRENSPTFQIGAIQVNMGRDIKWNPKFAEDALARAQELSLLAAHAGSQLSIWPETSIPYRGFRDDLNLTERIGNLARVSRTNLLVGSIEMAGDTDQHTYNTASLIGFQGGFEDRYDKQRLVPGGEFLPFESFLRKFSIFNRVMRYLPGKGSGLILAHLPSPTEGTPAADLRVGILICFESMVPSVAVGRVRAGAEALSVSTNDGWFGDSSAITHHFEMAIFRAVETARPIVQSGNTGLSGVINAYGEVLSETQANQKTFVVGPLVPGHERTFYVSWGDWVAGLAGLGWLCISLFCLSKWQQEGPGASLPKSPPRDQ